MEPEVELLRRAHDEQVLARYRVRQFWAALFRPARLAAALAAILSKATFLALILPAPALRADLAQFSTVFDLTCIVLLTALAPHEIRVSRRRPHPSSAPQEAS